MVFAADGIHELGNVRFVNANSFRPLLGSINEALPAAVVCVPLECLREHVGHASTFVLRSLFNFDA